MLVKDILIASKTETYFRQIKTRLKFRFKMTDLGKLSWFLGIQFECENNSIKMNQSRYIKKTLLSLAWQIANHAQLHVKWI